MTDVVASAYDLVAERYTALFSDDLRAHPTDGALIDEFVALVAASDRCRIGDLGCGPGHVSAHMHARGAEVSGFDASPAMVDIAQRNNPAIRFRVADLSSLPADPASFDGLLARYSVIHTSPDELHTCFAEFARVLVDEGHLLLSFQGAGAPDGHGEPFDHAVTTAFRLDPDRISDLLSAVGLDETARVTRVESTGRRFPQVSLMARRSG